MSSVAARSTLKAMCRVAMSAFYSWRGSASRGPGLNGPRGRATRRESVLRGRQRLSRVFDRHHLAARILGQANRGRDPLAAAFERDRQLLTGLALRDAFAKLGLDATAAPPNATITSSRSRPASKAGDPAGTRAPIRTPSDASSRRRPPMKAPLPGNGRSTKPARDRASGSPPPRGPGCSAKRSRWRRRRRPTPPSARASDRPSCRAVHVAGRFPAGLSVTCHSARSSHPA